MFTLKRKLPLSKDPRAEFVFVDKKNLSLGDKVLFHAHWIEDGDNTHVGFIEYLDEESAGINFLGNLERVPLSSVYGVSLDDPEKVRKQRRVWKCMIYCRMVGWIVCSALIILTVIAMIMSLFSSPTVPDLGPLNQ